MSYNAFDVDASGQIDKEEFLNAFRVIGYDVAPRVLIEVFEKFDTNGSGKLELGELKDQLIALSESNAEVEKIFTEQIDELEEEKAELENDLEGAKLTHDDAVAELDKKIEGLRMERAEQKQTIRDLQQELTKLRE